MKLSRNWLKNTEQRDGLLLLRNLKKIIKLEVALESSAEKGKKLSSLKKLLDGIIILTQILRKTQ